MLRAVSILLSLLIVVTVAWSADEPPPPNGWTEYSPRDRSFTVWLPDKGGRKNERERTITGRGGIMKITLVEYRVNDGPTFHASSVRLPAQAARLRPSERLEIFRDAYVEDVKGKILMEKDVKVGNLSGKEYTIQTGRGLVRLRLFVGGLHLYTAVAEGTKEQVEAKDAEVFLESFRLRAAPVDPPVDRPPGEPLSAEALTQALEDLKSDNKEKRKAAANLLSKAKPEGRRDEVAKVLLVMMTDQDIFIMQAAAGALKVWAAREDIPELAKLTGNQNIFIRGAAQDILSQFTKEESAAAAIAERLNDFLDRGKAGILLRKMGPVAEKPVLAQLKASDPATRIEACKVLAVIGTKTSLPEVEKLTQDANAGVAKAAKDAQDAIIKREKSL
jgi:HEAT repeat protein